MCRCPNLKTIFLETIPFFCQSCHKNHHKLVASTTEMHRLTALEAGSQVKASVGLAPSESYEEVGVPCWSANSWRFAGNLWHSMACRHITLIYAFVFTWPSLWVWVFVSKCPSPLHKDTSHIGLGAHLTQYDLILTNYTCNGRISKHTYFCGVGVGTSSYEFCGVVVQPITVIVHRWGMPCMWTSGRKCVQRGRQEGVMESVLWPC